MAAAACGKISRERNGFLPLDMRPPKLLRDVLYKGENIPELTPIYTGTRRKSCIGQPFSGILCSGRLVVLTRGHVMIDQGAMWSGHGDLVSDTKTGGQGGEGEREQGGVGVRQVELDAWHYL